MPFRPRVLIAVLLLAAACLAGCGASFGGVGGSDPNATDAAFVRGMVAHERATGSMAELARGKALRKELRQIAQARQSRHAWQLSAFTGLKEELRSISPAGAAIHREPPKFDPRTLRDAVSFDHEFLVRMVEQYEYAMAIAALERDHGRDRRIKAMAEKVYESSKRDLATLSRWLRTWYGESPYKGVPPAPSPGGGGSPPGPPV